MIIKRCPHCMEDLINCNDGPCPFCGFDQDAIPQPPEAMRRNTILHGKYLIGDVLGRGGFGITYIGFDLSLQIKVAIKEYYPSGFAARQNGEVSIQWNSSEMSQESREGAYNDFLREARQMAKIDQLPSIVRVRETFLENETAYIVMDYVKGETLKKRLQTQGPIDLAKCYSMLRPMMIDLSKVHAQGLIHRDISPDNIMLQPDGTVRLLDLGAAKDLAMGQNGVSQLVTKKGFSPIEQYMESGKIGAWTDVYALCATLYYCCSGKMIPASVERLQKDTLSFDFPAFKNVPAEGISILKKGLAVRGEERIQSMDDLVQQLDLVYPPPKNHIDEPHFRRLKWVIIGVSVAVLILLGFFIFLPSEVSGKEIMVSGEVVGIYTGEVKHGLPSGRGTMSYTNGDIYEGGWADGERSGYGIINYSDGLRYEGEWANGVKSGQGTLIYPEGNSSNLEKYEGEWLDDAMHGQGTLIWSNGSIYEGSFKNGQQDGQGKLTSFTGFIYEGEWANGEKNGQGILIYPEGNSSNLEKYEGEWLDDAMHGQGTLIWSNGSTYEGSFRNNQRDGQGTMTYSNGDIYEGEWVNGQRSGHGIYRWMSDQSYGYWFEGEWEDDIRNGKGIEYKPDGSVNAEGQWSNGQFVG